MQSLLRAARSQIHPLTASDLIGQRNLQFSFYNFQFAILLCVSLQKNLLRRSHPMKERLFKQSDPAKIRIGEMDSAIRFRRRMTRLAPDKARPRPNHRVSPTHHIQPFNQSSHVRVRPRKIR